jgi:hypothetical protein
MAEDAQLRCTAGPALRLDSGSAECRAPTANQYTQRYRRRCWARIRAEFRPGKIKNNPSSRAGFF